MDEHQVVLLCVCTGDGRGQELDVLLLYTCEPLRSIRFLLHAVRVRKRNLILRNGSREVFLESSRLQGAELSKG